MQALFWLGEHRNDMVLLGLVVAMLANVYAFLTLNRRLGRLIAEMKQLLLRAQRAPGTEPRPGGTRWRTRSNGYNGVGHRHFVNSAAHIIGGEEE